MSNTNAYDQGHPHGDMGPYNDYEPQAPPQTSYYQASNYGTAPPAQFTAAAPSSAGYDQGYSKLEGALKLETECQCVKRIGKLFELRIEARGSWQIIIYGNKIHPA